MSLNSINKYAINYFLHFRMQTFFFFIYLIIFYLFSVIPHTFGFLDNHIQICIFILKSMHLALFQEFISDTNKMSCIFKARKIPYPKYIQQKNK